MRYILLFIFTINLYASERIIALSPSINEIIFALGGGDKIVGNTEYCTYPKESIDKPKVGGYFSPSLEKMLTLKPDIVIMQQSSYKLSRQLEDLGIKTRVAKLKTLKDIKDTVKIIGDVLDEPKKADELLAKIEQSLNSIKGIIENKKILMVIDHKLSVKKRVFVAGQNLYFDDIINLSGNTNAFQSKRKGQPILNIENIIATNADIVVLLAPFKEKYGLTNEELIKPWKELPIKAAKNDNIYVIGKHYAGIASDRIVLFLEDFRRILQSVKDK
jgi:iron complex transport system substrate-binding protein